MPDQQQAQVPVAVEGASEPHEELANSTSGAAYELETSGDGEARQMAAPNDETADLFGSPLPLTDGGLQVGHTISSGSELSEHRRGSGRPSWRGSGTPQIIPQSYSMTPM